MEVFSASAASTFLVNHLKLYGSAPLIKEMSENCEKKHQNYLSQIVPCLQNIWVDGGLCFGGGFLQGNAIFRGLWHKRSLGIVPS